MALSELGRHTEAADVQAPIDAAFGGRDWWIHSDLPRWARGASASLHGGKGDGIAVLRATVDRMTDLGCWNWARFALADLAEAAADAGDSEAGAHALQLALSDPWQSDADSQRALRHFTEGAAALSRQDRETAATVLGLCAAIFAAVGWKMFEGRSMALLGHALAAIDRGRAIASMQQAIDLFDTCGAVVRRDRALDALGRLGPKGQRTKTGITGPEALTRREREVARLAANGCSAKEIATQLFIGERTVETHLANAYAKLGVASKVELVRLASQLEL
jgi:DNA-binding CsgD family transcriptional regulator